MANAPSPTTSPHPGPIPPRRLRQRGRGRAVALVFALIALSAAGWFFWRPLHGYAVTGTSYGARVACSCRFEGGRPLGDCRKDFESGMELISLSEDTQAKSVTARFPLIAKQTATYREGWGCVLEPWKD